jgi:hypothetical protein
LLGAFAAFIHVSRELREAQLRQFKTLLAQRKIERLRLANRSSLFPGHAIPRTQSPDLLDIAQGEWKIDDSTPTANDLGTGAIFEVHPNGGITQNPGVFSSCAADSIPEGLYCREVLIQQDVPVPDTALNLTISQSLPGLRSAAVTVWVRVLRKGETRQAAVVQSQVMVQ